MEKKSVIQQLDAVEEFERTPVPKEKWKGWGSFIGMYAGEHTAGTEFVIGPLFVAHGVTAGDLVFGLLVGNLLAVLSWAFLCAPIATKRPSLTGPLSNWRMFPICSKSPFTWYRRAKKSTSKR